jgi:hypothetical protein
MTAISDAVFTFLIASSLSGMAINTAVQLLPPPRATDYYRLESIFVPDAIEGAPIRMDVDREIMTDFQGRYSVTVRSMSAQGWRISCVAESAWREYRGGSAPLGDVDLAWWTDNECSNIPAGLAEICTAINIRVPGEPVAARCSNVFRIWAKPQERR